MKEIRYCAYIDVLGYRALVSDDTLSTPQKLQLLHSIYSNLATQFITIIRDIKEFQGQDIFMRSFSDCFYLDCSDAGALIVAVAEIFKNTFGFYGNFSEDRERTPFLRCGIVKDWLVKFRDIGAMANNSSELNPVGLAVARAYCTAEQSGLSGMRIIISPEVMNDLAPLHVTVPEFTCHVKDLPVYKVNLKYHFRHINKNEADKQTDLWELLWLASQMDTHAYEVIYNLGKLKQNFPGNAFRHFAKTVDMAIASLQVGANKYWNKERYIADLTGLNGLIQ